MIPIFLLGTAGVPKVPSVLTLVILNVPKRASERFRSSTVWVPRGNLGVEMEVPVRLVMMTRS